MTSSYRATGQASVRATPAAAMATEGVWAPSELAVPRAAHSPAPNAPVVTATMNAEERARLIDEGYARGLADGENKGFSAAQAQVGASVATLNGVVTQLNEASTLAPAVLE